MLRLDVQKLCHDVRTREALQVVGKLKSATGLLLSSTLPAAVGDLCRIQTPRGGSILAEVVGFSNNVAQLVAYEASEEIAPGLPVTRASQGLTVPVGQGLLGRVVDGLGRPIDNAGPLVDVQPQAITHTAPGAMERARITQPFITGQRAIDGLLTLGLGQRVGIFAGSGVGKSTLLGEIAKGSNADVNVIALIGERGREVKPFLDDCIGEEGMRKSVVVVATCDQTPLMRARAVQAALTMADSFRSQGKNVLLMVDSLTRLAMAQRELGLALGEPPSARGYTPSVFQVLANAIERMGCGATGSITGILTVLVDGGDLDEPISDSVRSFVDGHLVLDRKLAEKGQYPAVNIGQSISRITQDITDKPFRVAARKVRAAMATYTEAEDIIRIGAYTKGSSPQIDKAIELRPAILTFLKQEVSERTPFADTRTALEKLGAAWPY